MPEMPEVETLARQLRKTIVGKRIKDVSLSGLPLRKPIADDFAEGLKGRSIGKILRKGKYLIIQLAPKGYWVMHLGMSGRVLYHDSGRETAKHTHAVFTFTDATELEYRDHRRFGLLAFYENQNVEDIPEIESLGKDPLIPSFNSNWLWPLLQKSSLEIKAFLLDQHRIAGLGNIYACEALFLAQMHPQRRCFTFTSGQAEHLVGAIKKVLRMAIKHNGTTFSDFRNSDGKPGNNSDNLMIFQREGEECFRCGKIVLRMRQGGRSTFYCESCQQ
jgi:formamidopyrimidine-DNA glycosylase